jgi:hypothetical protein
MYYHQQYRSATSTENSENADKLLNLVTSLFDEPFGIKIANILA